MSNPFDGLNDEFGVEPSALQKHVEQVKPVIKKSDDEDVRMITKFLVLSCIIL